MDPNTLFVGSNADCCFAFNAIPISTILTIIIALFVAWVGFQQYLLSKARFKLDLFEKRYSVYKATQRFLTLIFTNARIDTAELFEFRGDTQDAVFLFGEDVSDYLEKIGDKALDMLTITEELEGVPVSDKRSGLCNKKSQLLRELTSELPRLKKVFGRYMKFDKWK